MHKYTFRLTPEMGNCFKDKLNEKLGVNIFSSDISLTVECDRELNDNEKRIIFDLARNTDIKFRETHYHRSQL